MRVFNINKAIGLASSGVEYAQSYRRELFAGIPWVDDFYVFTDYLGTNVSRFSDPLGFARSQVLWIYNLVAGRPTQPSTLTVERFLSLIGQPHDEPRSRGDFLEIALTDSAVRYRLRMLAGGVVDRVETHVRDRLLRIEHYDATLNNVEHFHENRLARRVFYTSDGRVAAEQSYREQEILRTRITPASPLYDRSVRAGRARTNSFGGDVVLEGRAQFFQFVFRHLFDRVDDVVIVDRALDVIDGIYPVLGDHRLYSVVHAEHFDPAQASDGVLLWNNHYENVFTRPDLVDGLIVSTDRQKHALERQLASRGPSAEIPVVSIPVGVVTRSLSRADYDRSAIVTASRLADEKHLDLLIRAVVQARAAVPGLRLDIFGEGGREQLLTVIRKADAAEFVRLLGHQKLDGLLGGYGLYVSASTSEGFGLSLLEAAAEGLPIVGFDVDYGNRELVEPGANGVLVPFTSTERDVAELADAIIRVLTSESLDEWRAASLRKAQAYAAPRVRARWERLLRGEASC